MTGPALRLWNVGARTGDHVLLDGVDLDLAPGRVVAVIGESGAGKSTLGLAVLGESAPGVTVSGSVRVGDVELLGIDAAQRRDRRAGRVGHLPQHPGVVLDPVRRCGRVLTELAAVVHPRDRAAQRQAVRAALDRVALPGSLARRYPHQLSGGQQQRMALAQTVVTAPEVVVLDEPTTGLDPATAGEVVAQLAALAAGGTAMVLLTHDHGVARALADEVVELDAGRVVRRGTPAETLGSVAHADVRGPRGTGAERLAIEGLTVRAADGRALLDGVDLAAGAGEWLAVHGRSGAGKTTLARAVAGLVAPREGAVRVDGVRLAAAVDDRDRAARRRVQYVHQDAASSFLPDRSVLDQVARPGVLLRGLDTVAARAEATALLERLGVPASVCGRRPGALSGGQLQRAAVARAMTARPSVLVADEMTSALDPHHRRELVLAVDELRRETGTTVVAVSHDLELTAAVADRVVVLDGGRLVETTTVEDLLAAPGSEAGRALVAGPGG